MPFEFLIISTDLHKFSTSARYLTPPNLPYSVKIRLTLSTITDTIQVQPYNFNIHFKCKGDFTMMYMHYCKRCHRVYMLNGHKQQCPKCRDNITELKITYMDYVSMNMETREQFCDRCADEEQLPKLSTTYRMYKYSKWYKESQSQFPQTTFITYALTSNSSTDRSPMENAVSVV